MEAIFIEPKDEKELELLKKIAELIGAKSTILSNSDLKMLAGLRIVEIANSHPKFEISHDEIMNMAKEVEDEVYAKWRR